MAPRFTMPGEWRLIQIPDLELRSRAGMRSSAGRLTGHAAIFDEVADLGEFGERFSRGAFRDSLRTDDIRALFNHDPNIVFGRNKVGTLKLTEDARGLAFEIDLP